MVKDDRKFVIRSEQESPWQMGRKMARLEGKKMRVNREKETTVRALIFFV